MLYFEYYMGILFKDSSFILWVVYLDNVLDMESTMFTIGQLNKSRFLKPLKIEINS